ncbi:MAG: PD-(D/E)XK nuclease family protein, partial [Clostridia bacterium]|nr:PD-(D/E)XK nuclease family protein [Clostridia bacterium]
MVSFISGRASSGKTYEVYKRISELAKQKESIVLVVPEQFSFETEKAMLDLLGEASLNYVSVLPFSRIYETVGRLTGGICGKVLTAADKHILIDRAISSVAGELSLWKKYSSSMHFSSQMLNSIDEFKYAGINSVDLKNAAECVVNKKLKQKLSDTAVIYEAYTSLLGTAFLDPSDYMDRLYDMLEKCNYFEDKNVFFDGFKSFSGQQFKVIDRIVSAAKNAVFTFVDDQNDTRRFSILANVRKTKNRVLRILEANNLTLHEDIYLETNNYKNRDLVSLEKALFSGEFSDGSPKSDITVCEAETIYDEAEYTARTIRKLVREEGASYSDFVVIARDTTTYEDALTISCKRNKVNVFIDKKIALSTMPISKLIISAIEYTKKATTESIIDFYKTGITGVAFDDISEVEQYCVIWNIKAKDFENEWDMNPDGLTDRISEDIDEKLSRLNDFREKMLAPLKEFKTSFSGTPKQRAKAIFALLNNLDVPKNLSELCEHYKEQGEFEFADVLRQSYSQFISLLDNVVACFPDTVVSKPVFFDALKTVLSLNSVGVVPQTLDEVVFGSAERIRPARPKYVFILGANQGIYPRLKVSTGLFTNNDLTTLKDFGLDISNKTLDLSVDEQFLIYSNLCCASDKVFITYCKNLADNTPALPSRFVTQILELNVNRVFEPSNLNVGNLPETLNCAVLERFKRINDKTPDSQTIYEAIAVECKRDNINLDKYEISAENSKLSESVVRDFCGNKIRLSATSLERYSMCHFMYFCRHIANAQNRDKAEISPMNRGTIVHFVLEKILAEYKENISKLTPAEISDGVDKFCDDYLDSIPGYRSVETERLKYLIYSIRRIIKDVVTRIALEFEQSKFK